MLTIAGVMSGTSLDGIDVAIITIEAGLEAEVQVESFYTRSYPQQIKQRLIKLVDLEVDDPETMFVEVAQLNIELGELYARAVKEAARQMGIEVGEIDLIGCHGQTIFHRPDSPFTLSMQLGSGAGIANYTALPANCERSQVSGSDTGPGNMPIDAGARYFTDSQQEYDYNGEMASQGEVDKKMLADLWQHEFFARPRPRSTGRRDFGSSYVIPTLTKFTAETIVTTIQTDFRTWSPDEKQDFPVEVIVSGGASYFRGRNLGKLITYFR